MALRICCLSVASFPGACGIRIALVRDDAPISLSLSKYGCPHDVKHEQSELPARVVELGEGVVDLLGQHAVLNRYDHPDEDVVFGLRLDLDVELLNPKIDATDDSVL